jgi:four helix bundle protein
LKDFRDLKAWQKAHLLVTDVCRSTSDFPADERYGLTAQLRRSAVSVASNIAEGCGRGTDRDFARFLTMATGSASECEYQILLALELGYISENHHDRLVPQVVEIRRMLTSLIKRLQVGEADS